jgi:hypothetical protein
MPRSPAAEATAVFVREMRQKGHPFSHEPTDPSDPYTLDRHVRPNDLALQRQF